MTGLDTDADASIEVAALVTDFELQVLGDGVDIVIKPPAGAIEQMADVVRTMHTHSGLLDELASGVDLATAERQVLDYVREFVPEERKAPSPATQWARTGSSLRATCRCSRRTCTTGSSTCRRSRSSLDAGTRRPTSAARPKTGNHRALADIQESIEELRYYRATVFVPPPGPDSETARALAAEHGGALTSRDKPSS